MPLEAGSVFVRIAGLFDKSEFDKADKAVAAQRANAKDPITYTVGIDSAGVAKQGATARAEVDAEAAKPVDIPIGLDTKALTAEVAAAREEVKRGIGSPNSGSGDPFTLSLGEDDRSLLRSFSESKGGGHRDVASHGVKRAESDARGAKDDSHLSLGHFIEGMLHTPGGFMGMGKFGLGSMIGLGPEHAITAGASMLGTLGPAAAGGGLIGAGWLGREAVGGGADALVGHETRSNIQAIYKDMTALDQVQQQYGKDSKESAAAQKTFNAQLDALGKGPGTRAEAKVAAQVHSLVSDFKKGSQDAQAESANMMGQVVSLGQKYLPLVIAAATKNLGIVDKSIKPLFSWLEGPQGKGIFEDLENDFSKRLPGSIKMATSAIELVLKLMRDAANLTHGESPFEKFFNKENNRSAASLEGIVKKLVGDFHDWTALLGAFGKVFGGIMHDSAHEGIGLVNSLTKVLDKMAAWEKSATGSSELHKFFEGRKTELDAILKSFGPLLKVFFQFYMDVQSLVPGVTDVFKILTAILTPIEKLAGHSKLFNDMFVLPMGMFLLVWKRFGWEKAVGLVRNLATGFGLLGKKTEDATKAQSEFNKAQGAKSVEAGAEGDAAKDAERDATRTAGGGGLLGLLRRGMGGASSKVEGTLADPEVVTVVDPRYGQIGSKAKGYEKAEEGAAGEQKEIPGLERDGSQKSLTGFEDAELAGRTPGGLKKDAEDVSTDAGDSGGILSKLKSLLGIGGDVAEGAEGAGAAGAVEGAIGTASAAAPEAATGIAGLLGSLGPIAAIAAPIAAVVAAVLGLAKATGTLGHLKDEVIKPFGDAFKQIGTIINQALGGKGGAGDLLKTIKTDASDAFGAIKDFLQSPGFKQGFKDFEDVLGVIAHILSIELVGAVQEFITVIKGLVKVAADVVSDFVDQFKGLFLIIKGLITLNGADIMKGFEDIGKGMLDGLKAVFVDIPEMIGGLFMDMVHTVEKILGIASPSTVFMSIGKSMVDGIMSALESLPGLALKIGEDLVKGIVHGVENVGKDVGNVVTSVVKGADKIVHVGGDFNPLNWHARGGELPGFARGGTVPGREYGLTDRMTLVDPAGRPRARMAGDESVYTRHQRPYVDAGLRAIGIGGSSDLWNRVRTPHSYSGGGSLLSGDGHIQNFAGGGTIKPNTDRRTMTASGLTTSGTLSRFGQGALNAIDTKVANLDNTYTTQSNIYDLYSDGGSGDLTTKQLNVLMGIREQQWDLLYKEWLTLPAALRSLQTMTYGTDRSSKTGTGGINRTVNDLKTDVTSLQTLITDIGSDTKPTTDSGSAAYEKLTSYYNGQTPSSIASTASSNAKITQANALTRRNNSKDQATIDKQSSAANNNIPNGPSAETMNAVYRSNAATMTGYTSQLSQVHKTSLGLTNQIVTLLSRTQSSTTRKEIANLRQQRVTNNDKAITLAGQLSDIQNTNETIAVQWKDASYYNRMARAAAETGLSGKTAELETVLAQLQTALSNEEKLESAAVSAIAAIKGDESGTGSSGESTVNQLGDYGYDIMGLNQQGAKVPQKYQLEIDKVFKALGVKLPGNWANAAATAQATQGEASFQSFQQSLSSTFGSFGSNFVGAGANPYKGAGKLAGATNYGAAAGPGSTVHERGGEMHGTPYGGTGGDTTISITQHFGGPPPDAHTYSNGLQHELTSMIG